MYLIPVGMILMAGLFFLDARRWRLPDSVVNRTQKILRISLIVLIEVGFLVGAGGVWALNHRESYVALLGWTICLGLGFVAVILVAFDLRESAREYGRLSHKISRELRGDSENKR